MDPYDLQNGKSLDLKSKLNKKKNKNKSIVGGDDTLRIKGENQFGAIDDAAF